MVPTRFYGKVMMVVMLSGLALAASAQLTQGAWIGGVYWADDVVEWSGAVQNYGGTLMSWDTTWWLTGPSDADVDGNGYAWDPGDDDFVAGWRSSGEASVTVYFLEAIRDRAGSDLVIHKYAGPNAIANVYASSDGIDYVQIGSMDGGTPGYFVDVYLDFAGLVDEVHYVRIERVASGPQTGTFIDSLAAVPEPSIVALVGLGAIAALVRRRRLG